MGVPVSVVILTYNSEADLDRCLSSVAGWAGEIFIVDSFSQDATPEIAKRYGARVHTNRFQGFAAQENWALDNLPFAYNWAFFLDADEEVLPELREEIGALFRGGEPHEAGFYIRRRFVWMGRWLRYGGYYPAEELQLFRHKLCRVVDAGLRDYRAVQGSVGRLRNDTVHDARKTLAYWIEKHVMYAGFEAREMLTGAGAARLQAAAQSAVHLEGAGRNRFRERVWNRLPLFVRPLVLFVYRYIVRLGFLDGVPGLSYCFLHELWYQFLIDLNYRELRQQSREKGSMPSIPTSR